MLIEEYYRTSFEDGDREFVDGVILERNLGLKPHAFALKRVILAFTDLERHGVAVAFPSQRVQVSATRCRVPDVCVYLQEPEADVFRTPPFLVIEILSPEDRAADLQEKIVDYLQFGVPYICVIDPWCKRAHMHTANGSYPVRDGALTTENPRFELPLGTLFS